jgi:hypothetical protein
LIFKNNLDHQSIINNNIQLMLLKNRKMGSKKSPQSKGKDNQEELILDDHY